MPRSNSEHFCLIPSVFLSYTCTQNSATTSPKGASGTFAENVAAHYTPNITEPSEACFAVQPGPKATAGPTASQHRACAGSSLANAVGPQQTFRCQNSVDVQAGE